MSDSRGLPRVSVIMPVRNEEGHLAESLQAVLDQDYPAEILEVLVVDGCSEDSTREIARAVAAGRPRVACRLLDNPQQIAAAALNRGVQEAAGEVIVRVDGHCVIVRDYVRRAVETLRSSSEAGCVGGPVEHIGDSPMSRAIAAAMGSSFGVGGSPFRTISDRRMRVDTVPFPAFWRRSIETAGPFDESLVRNQDDEYSYRLRGLGFDILMVPEMRTRYRTRSSLGSLWRQYFGYGVFKVPVLLRHRRRTRLRHLAPAAFVSALGGALAILPWSLLPAVAVAAPYVLANLSASLTTARKHGWELLLRLPACFACLHVAYGLGFLLGLLGYRSRGSS